MLHNNTAENNIRRKTENGNYKPHHITRPRNQSSNWVSIIHLFVFWAKKPHHRRYVRTRKHSIVLLLLLFLLLLFVLRVVIRGKNGPGSSYKLYCTYSRIIFCYLSFYVNNRSCYKNLLGKLKSRYNKVLK